MHIPDGFLDAKTIIGTYALSAGALGYSIKKTKEEMSDRQVPTMGVLAAFIFAAQMVNFPIVGGTSGHLLGAALTTILLGPWCSAIIISTVLIIQCLFFQDGGLTALGGNIFNMAVVGTLVALALYRLVSRLAPGKKGEMAGIFIASWASVVAAAFFATVELALSGTFPFKVALGAMMGWHVIIGLGEGLITLVAVSFVRGMGLQAIAQQGKTGKEV
ncbi:MAG: energy-coupling factor ABC transporter permease [Peptococcaceae bacterium]|nr:energy-coupling factor ABC transporter permease [Peptococcaceae bacterium]